MPPRELTVKEFAARERVTKRTVYTWIDKGAVEFRRTPGGSIRIADPRPQPTGASRQTVEDR